MKINILNKENKKNIYKCFVVMRCWHPRADEVIKNVRLYNPNEIILMPLYPQYSAATSGSSIKEWNEVCKKNNYKIKIKIFKNCEHKISVEGLSLGLEFLRKNLL